MKKTLLSFAALLFLALPGLSQADLSGRARAALAQTSGRLAVAGLSRPVTVLRDPWGIPHIYAETQDDLFFAQGFVAAQDRLFQMEIWRRTAEGRLAEILGPAYVERDRIARLLRYRGDLGDLNDLETEYASYAPDAKGIVEAFVRGVNAYIETVRDRPPVEFELAGFRPEPWTPEVCLNRLASLGVTGYAVQEVVRALLIREMGVEVALDLYPPEPPAPLQVPKGLDLALVDPGVLAGFLAAGAPVRFEERDGSNNWVVDGALSATGRPLLANDPHRAIGVPSLRWMVHLVGPGWNVIGAGEPALPGVAAGHNDRVGFGFTVVGIDQQDLYVEEVNPGNPNEVRAAGRWVPVRIERETIRVKGAEPVAVDLRFTAHGPVIFEDPARHRAWALRWVGSEPGTAGYLGSLALDRARSWPEFLAALERWKVPSENLVYADVEGNIGWKVAGLTPVRKGGWHGLLPVPGDGRYEWQGFLPAAELPQDFNPGRHFIATANHNILPPGYRHELGHDWASLFRFDRIVETLSQPGRRFTVEDFQRLQYDDESRPARELVDLLARAQGADADLKPWIERLARWNRVVSKDSGEAALYEIWREKLPAELQKRAPEPVRPLLARAFGSDDLLRLLGRPTARWFGRSSGETPTAGRDAALLSALREAVAETRKLLGDDPAKWRWGALHVTGFRHPLADLDPLFELPSHEISGDGDAVHVTVGRKVVFGASFREILDVADWDRSVATSVPGQSGQPLSPHYADLLPLWAEGRYFPLLFSRERIEAESKDKLVLEPLGRQP